MFAEHEKQIPKVHQEEEKKKKGLPRVLLKNSKRRKILLGDTQAYYTSTTIRTVYSEHTDGKHRAKKQNRVQRCTHTISREI